MQNSQLLWDWLQEGANVYVCRDASHMGKDVYATLQKSIATEGNMSTECAQEYVTALKDQHRYHRDPY